MIQTGQQIEHYRIDDVISEGGMGTVYRATDVNLMRPVAVKVMHGELADDPAFQARFLQEARAAARLDHPSIVRVYHFGREGGQLYIVMELVEGVSLGAYLRQLAKANQVVRLEETLTLIAQAADALGYAHRQGVIHRDVKPDNILVKRIEFPDRPGDPPLRATLTDFGLAKLLETDSETQTGLMMGTLPYMSPEQVLDLPTDGRSDIYSLGVVLYQLATGRLPLDIRSPERALQAHQYEEVPVPSAVHPGVPAALETVILRALARRPENRYQTAESLAADLRRVAGTLSNEEARAFAEDTDSTVVSMVTEFPTPARRLEWDMRPRELHDEGVCRVLLQNHSPATQTVALAVETPKGGLYVDAARKQITLAPGQMGVVDFYLQGIRRPSVGRRRAFPFMVRVMPLLSSGEVAPGMDGRVTTVPPLPLWLAGLLVLLVLALCGLAVWTLTSLPALDNLLSALGL
jgi:tRNA A-37 threonylcarbamoyl transferase component Bud32